MLNAGSLEQYGNDGTKNFRYWANKYIGSGLHTVMDSTSPAHEGFKKWPNVSLRHPHIGLLTSHLLDDQLHNAKKVKAETVAKMLKYLNNQKCSCEH